MDNVLELLRANKIEKLSVGDGLVAQIPSLLLAMATAVIVTRITSDFNLSDQISQEEFKNEIAKLESRDTGKPISLAKKVLKKVLGGSKSY